VLVVVFKEGGVGTDVERGHVENVQLENWFGSERIVRRVLTPSWNDIICFGQMPRK
jgi:hypothetical protein